VLESFTDTPFNKLFIFKCIQVVPQISVILSRFFSLDANVRTFINARLLPLISSTMQLKEVPLMWLNNRMHTIVQHRQQIPIARIDLMHLMLRTMSEETITVSKLFTESEVLLI